MFNSIQTLWRIPNANATGLREVRREWEELRCEPNVRGTIIG